MKVTVLALAMLWAAGGALAVCGFGPARQLEQLVPAALIHQVASLLVPGAEHDALRRLAIDAQLVDAGPVSVPVNDAPDAGRPQSGRDGFAIDIHDVRDRAGGVLAAAGARLSGQQLAVGERQGPGTPQPLPGSDDASQIPIPVIL